MADLDNNSLYKRLQFLINDPNAYKIEYADESTTRGEDEFLTLLTLTGNAGWDLLSHNFGNIGSLLYSFNGSTRVSVSSWSQIVRRSPTKHIYQLYNKFVSEVMVVTNDPSKDLLFENFSYTNLITGFYRRMILVPNYMESVDFKNWLNTLTDYRELIIMELLDSDLAEDVDFKAMKLKVINFYYTPDELSDLDVLISEVKDLFNSAIELTNGNLATTYEVDEIDPTDTVVKELSKKLVSNLIDVFHE